MSKPSPLPQAIKQINEALALHQGGKIRQAQTIYEQVLRSLCDVPESGQLAGLIHNSLGLALHHQGEFVEAVTHYQHAIALRPDFADTYCNLGNSQRALGRVQEAMANFRRTLELDPGNIDAHVCLGLAFQEQEKHIEAVDSYQKALALKPDLAAVHNNLGTAFQHLLRFDNAAASYRQALAIQPTYIDALCNLGFLLKQFDQIAQAIECFQQVLNIDPHSGVALHEIATLSGKVPERAPDDYIVTVFDEYADKFDAHVQEHLDYRVPQKLAGLVAAHRAGQSGKLAVLDLGCGTGLAGVAIAPLSGQLVGVDLSANMLRKASEKGLYQRLVQADLLSMMQQEATASYDLIIAADVFVYIGKLDEIMREAKRLLRPAGLLAFSVKALEASENEQPLPDFELRSTGRYRHAPGYLAAVAKAQGFAIVEQTLTTLRTEKNQPVNGYISLWRA